MGTNWMEKWEKESDERWEKHLKKELEEYMTELAEIKTSIKPINNKELRKLLRKIADTYSTLKVQHFDYDAEEYNNILRELQEINYKILEEDSKESTE